MAEIDIEEALGDLKDVLQPIHKALSHVTREVRPSDAAFTRLCKIVRALQAEVRRLRQLGFDHVDSLEHSQSEATRRRAELAELRELRASLGNVAQDVIDECNSHKKTAAELDWFKRREPLVEALMSPYESKDELIDSWDEVRSWEFLNTKPGAAT